MLVFVLGFSSLMFTNSFSKDSKQLYVSVKGSDTEGDGTLNKPYRTIQKAAEMAEPGETVSIGGGVYRETVIPKNSGLSGAPITFTNYNNENVVISGCDEMQSKWVKYSGKIYKTSVELKLGESNQLFVDKAMYTLAKWPNNTSDNPLLVATKSADSGSKSMIKDSDLKFSSNYLKDAKVWFSGGRSWYSQTTEITASKTGQITLGKYTEYGEYYDPIHGNAYYVFDKLSLLDAGKEWYYKNKTLYMQMPDGNSPEGHSIEYKVRQHAFDLTDKSFITLKGINVLSADLISTMACHDILLKNMNFKYISSFSENSKGWGSHYDDSGVRLLGYNNVIRDSRLSYSSHVALLVSGHDSSIINCEISMMNYATSGVAGVLVYGDRILVSHNSIHDAGRDVLQWSTINSSFEYNDIYYAGRLSDDVGGMYTSFTGGYQNTQFHHNKIHDTMSGGLSMGLYPDEQSSECIIYNNVFWNCSYNGIRLNLPSCFNLVYNNTCDTGSISSIWGTTGDYATGSQCINNLIVSAGIDIYKDYVSTNNMTYQLGTEFINQYGRDYRLDKASKAIDAGRVIPGITDGFTGKAPDIGAYENGGESWTAGCDFNNPPNPVLKMVDTPYMQKLKNSTFERINFCPYDSNTLGEWIPTDNKTAVVKLDSFPGGNYSKTGLHGLELKSGPDGVVQNVTGLQPNKTYRVTGWLKPSGPKDPIRLGVRNFGGTEIFKEVTENKFTFVEFTFKTGADNTTADIFIFKPSGTGSAYADTLGVQLAEKMEGLTKPITPSLAKGDKVIKFNEYEEGKPMDGVLQGVNWGKGQWSIVSGIISTFNASESNTASFTIPKGKTLKSLSLYLTGIKGSVKISSLGNPTRVLDVSSIERIFSTCWNNKSEKITLSTSSGQSMFISEVTYN